MDRLIAAIASENSVASAAPLIDGKAKAGPSRPIVSPIDGTTIIGSVVDATPDDAKPAVIAARRGFLAWSRTPAETRAEILERAADLLEQESAHFIALLQREGGKTLDDAFSEVREAVDFCRYYAAEGRELFGDDTTLPGPTGESNMLRLRGRGVFVAISPWNFPLAIFTGPSRRGADGGKYRCCQTCRADAPDCALRLSVCCMQAGVPVSALHLVPGDGSIGAALVGASAILPAWSSPARPKWRVSINRALAAKDGPIVPLIAETGGINAMIVDATALPEQVADDVVTSAFRSAGQRCSALRLLFVQDDVADRMIEMIAGAARELQIGDPRDPATHIGPVIDCRGEAAAGRAYRANEKAGRAAFRRTAPEGNYVAPHIFELADAAQLTEEVFGPVLHVVRYPADSSTACCNRSSAAATG